jgi:hypothetical protein
MHALVNREDSLDVDAVPKRDLANAGQAITCIQLPGMKSGEQLDIGLLEQSLVLRFVEYELHGNLSTGKPVLVLVRYDSATRMPHRK